MLSSRYVTRFGLHAAGRYTGSTGQRYRRRGLTRSSGLPRLCPHSNAETPTARGTVADGSRSPGRVLDRWTRRGQKGQTRTRQQQRQSAPCPFPRRPRPGSRSPRHHVPAPVTVAGTPPREHIMATHSRHTADNTVIIWHPSGLRHTAQGLTPPPCLLVIGRQRGTAKYRMQLAHCRSTAEATCMAFATVWGPPLAASGEVPTPATEAIDKTPPASTAPLRDGRNKLSDADAWQPGKG